MLAAVVLAGELGDWLARRSGRSLPAGQHPDALVVLGFPGHTAVTRAVQGWRVRMAVGAQQRWGCRTVVFSGGAVKGDRTEASQMAARARSLGLAEGCIVVEAHARSTWENVHLSRPLVRDASLVAIVSDGLHAHRAKRYWHRQFPEAREVVVVDPAYRLLDHWWVKLPSAAAQLARALRDLMLAVRSADAAGRT